MAEFVQSPMTKTWHTQAKLNDHWVSITRCGRHFKAEAAQDEEPATGRCAECWQARWWDAHPAAAYGDDD